MAVQVTCELMHGHIYHLTKSNSANDEPTPKKARCQRPVSANDFAEYKFVLPSSRTVTEFKLSLAAQEEANASLALLVGLYSY